MRFFCNTFLEEDNMLDNSTAAFVIPYRGSKDRRCLSYFEKAIHSIEEQTDPDWIIILVDDRSPDPEVIEHENVIGNRLGDRIHILRCDVHVGVAEARNIGVRKAHELGCPFILFMDADDMSHPKRLENARNFFSQGSNVNVVYSSFYIIDEDDKITPFEEVNGAIREIWVGHQDQVVEGEDAWIQIATKKNYTTLSSHISVRTDLAIKHPFPRGLTVSEDSYTWMQYAAEPGIFVFDPQTPCPYRICRWRKDSAGNRGTDFNRLKAVNDTKGFMDALKVASKYRDFTPEEVDDLTVRFYVRLALTISNGGCEEEALRIMRDAIAISKDTVLDAISQITPEEYKTIVTNIYRKVI